MDMKGIFITRDLSIYTLNSLPRKPAFINLWEVVGKPTKPEQYKWRPVKTVEIHPKACTGMKVSNEGIICVQSSDGYAIQIDLELDSIKTGERLHKMPISAIGFTETGYITGSTDYAYNFVAFNEGFNITQFLTKLAIQLALFSLIMFVVIDYIMPDQELETN